MSEHNPAQNGQAPYANQNQPRRPQHEITPIPLDSRLDTPHDRGDGKDALDIHLNMMEVDDYAEATIDSHERRLTRILDWFCPNPLRTEEENAAQPGPDITHTGELASNPRIIQDWKMERGAEVAKATLKTECDTVRVFFRSLEDYDALPQGFHRFVESPTLSENEERRDDAIDIDRAREITEYLRKYEWGSERHVLWELIWTTAMRLQGAHSIDESDVSWEQGQIQLRHRPDTGTTLKNGSGMGKEGGERNVIVPQTVLDVIEDWLDNPDRADDPVAEGGRVPLLPDEDGTGRRGKEYLRKLTYAMTRPCAYGAGCPHDKDPTKCPAAQAKNKAYACPSSTTPHPVRKGAITRMRNNDVPRRVVSHEVDASEAVLDKHYDDGDADQRAEIRREYLERDDAHRDK
ncbi:site-specific integrase [Halobacteriaceae archaeon SHR40]|uniref:tyrosine-type recombinase/integrase n=1 Tax=Halovenus amylolytica TaxID=2500550 RepID=UPI000FE3DCE0